MKKEDFKNPMDWIIYKVNGKMPNTTEHLSLNNNTVSNGKYGVKYYKNKNGRYSAMYHKEYLCMCDYEDIEHIQNYFDRNYDGKNISKISKHLKKEYNQKIKKSKRGVKPKPYSKNRLNFQSKKGGRVCARVSDNGKVHHICQCYENQKKEVSDRYDALKKEYDINNIKEIMKKEYNIVGRTPKNPHLNNHQINIMQDGSVYKDGKFMMVDSNIYDFIDVFIRR